MNRKLHIFLAILIMVSATVHGQVDSIVYVEDQQTYIQPPTYDFNVGREYNDEVSLNHPDFGKLTFKAPYGKNVVEVLSKRKEDERYYVDLDDPTFFYIEKSASPINFWKDGYLRAIDASLYPAGNGEWESGEQPVKTKLDINQGFTEFYSEEKFVRNNRLKLKIVHNDNSFEVLDPNWSNTEVYNFGAYVTDIFPGIDLKLKFKEGKIKSDYIINQNLNVKHLIFIDEIDLSPDLNVQLSFDNAGQEYVEIYEQFTGETAMVGRPAVTYDNSGNKQGYMSHYNVVNDHIYVTCDSSIINNSSAVYPIVVDPTFIAVGPVFNGFAVMGSLLSPSSCTDNLVVTYPAGSTPWDVQFYLEVFTNYCTANFINCWRSEAQVWITSSCGGGSPAGFPGTIWTCAPGCNSPGFWTPTIGFNASGTQSLAQCYTPSCSPQNLTFTNNFNRSWCNSSGGNDICNWATTNCQAMDDWSITVQGRSVETLGNTATGNGSQNIYDADCAGTQLLDPTPLYGVPGYTYSWNPGGATTPTLTVPGTVSTYTCDVTDACGNTVTATFDIGCPLSTNLVSFDGLIYNGSALLNWTLSQEDDIESYLIQKSTDGSDWRDLGLIASEGLGKYEITDHNPETGFNYYRIQFNKKDGTKESSEVLQLKYYQQFALFPNPANDQLNIVIDDLKVNTEILIKDLTGKEIMNFRATENKTVIDLESFNSGVYVVFLIKNGEFVESQRLSVK